MEPTFLFHVSRITNEHSDWMRSIDFYKEEIDILRKRLAEVSSHYTQTEVKAEVEHYQNQFLIQLNNLSDLKHDVKRHEHHMANDVDKMDSYLANNTLAEHDNLRDRYYSLEKTINELRHEFNKFLARYM